MGWLNDFEQQQLLLVYGKLAQYRCDLKTCRKPIFIDEIYVVDSTAGVYPRDKNDPTAGFLAPRYRKTYHRKCDDIRRGRPLKEFYPRTAATPEELAKMPSAKRMKKEAAKNKNTVVKLEKQAIPESKRMRKARLPILKLVGKRPPDYWMKSKLVVGVWKRTKIDRAVLRNTITNMVLDGTLRKDGRYINLPKKKRSV